MAVSSECQAVAGTSGKIENGKKQGQDLLLTKVYDIKDPILKQR